MSSGSFSLRDKVPTAKAWDAGSQGDAGPKGTPQVQPQADEGKGEGMTSHSWTGPSLNRRSAPPSWREKGKWALNPRKC